MKKVIFGAAALLFSGAIFAQANQGSLTDTKGNSSVDATIIAPLAAATPGGNTGLSVQNGNTNKVQVRQAGSLQSVYTNQSDGLGSGDNKARIWQTGNVAPPPSGYANAADVQQMGSDNQASVRQEGDFNEAVTKQGMKDGGLSSGNKLYINHGINEQGESNYAMVEQDGQDNTSKTVQVYDNSEARTVQDGDNNMADIRQNAGPNQSAGHSALLEQDGDMNASRIRQDGENRNTAHSAQKGTGNKVNQNQTSDGGSGIGNLALVDQGNGFVPIGGGLFSVWDTDLQNVDDTQNGSFNGSSDNAKALQNQTGTSNAGFIGQFGDGSSVGNYAEQNQNGDANGAIIQQNAFGNANGGDNYARQNQYGDNNVAGIAQNGTDHLAYQRQYGSDNSALSTQRGSDNHVSTYQGGDGNALETGQRGTMNTILVVQKEQGYGGHSYKVSQNLPGGTPVGGANGGNIADILQLGPNGDFVNDAEGCDFQDPQNLTMPGGVSDFDIANPCDDGSGNGC